MTRPQSPVSPMSRASTSSLAMQLVMSLDEMVQQRLSAQTQARPRLPSLNVPLVGSLSPSVGWVASVAVSFNVRVVGYQLFSLVSGQLTIDIQRSTPVTHPVDGVGTPLQFPSLIGDPAVAPVTAFPSINGIYADSFSDPALDPTSVWASRDLASGDMLHFWITETDSAILYCTLLLYLQDLDETVDYSSARYT
jgi:hypothetical protein